MSAVDWSEPKCPVSKYFTVREAIWLPKWNRLASAGDGLTQDACVALVMMFQKMDVVQEFLNRPINVHIAFRSVAYNAEINGAKNSCHVARKENGVSLAAVDWDAKTPEEEFLGQSCDLVRPMILPKLEEWDLRLEDNGPGKPWLHLDCRPVYPGMNRFFKP